MKDFLVADRYAGGLNASLPDDATLEAALDELRRMAGAMGESHTLRTVLLNPAIARPQRLAVLKSVCAALSIGDVVAGLLEVMLRRSRIDLLDEVVVLFAHRVDSRLNRVLATVTTAAPLDEPTAERIRLGLEHWSGKSVRMECVVNPAVLGGVAAQVGGTVMDGTIKARLKQLRGALLEDER